MLQEDGTTKLVMSRDSQARPRGRAATVDMHGPPAGDSKDARECIVTKAGCDLSRSATVGKLLSDKKEEHCGVTAPTATMPSQHAAVATVSATGKLHASISSDDDVCTVPSAQELTVGPSRPTAKQVHRARGTSAKAKAKAEAARQLHRQVHESNMTASAPSGISASARIEALRQRLRAKQLAFTRGEEEQRE